MSSNKPVNAAAKLLAGIFCAYYSVVIAFSPPSSLDILMAQHPHYCVSSMLFSTTTVSSEEVDTAERRKQPNTKFAALMAGKVSSPSCGFESITWDDGDDEGIIRSCGAGGNVVHTANKLLPDDEVSICDLPTLHNKRALYYHPSLLTKDESSSLIIAAETSGLLEQFDSRCAVIVEDGIYQQQSSSPSLASLLRPILKTKIVPWAREMCNMPTLTVADALIRSYDPAEEKQDLTTHYDNTAFVTIVVALNDPSQFSGGLFVQTGANVDTRLGVPFSSPGGAVMHRFDVMHGVNVRSGNKRYSLVIWFAENKESVVTKTVPWVKREAEQRMSVHAAFLYAVNSQYGTYGVDTNVPRAKEYYTWASDRGHALSTYCLSNILFKESTCSNDISKEEQIALRDQSFALLELSAERGLADAQHELGITYKQGYKGIPSDFEIARYWFRLAEKQGHGASSQILNDPSRWRVD